MPADSVKAALKILGTEHIDAMVLDVRLPDETGLYRSGLDLLQFVRATPEYVQMPVLVLSGQPLSSGEDQLVIAQGAHLFYKPNRTRICSTTSETCWNTRFRSHLPREVA